MAIGQAILNGDLNALLRVIAIAKLPSSMKKTLQPGVMSFLDRWLPAALLLALHEGWSQVLLNMRSLT